MTTDERNACSEAVFEKMLDGVVMRRFYQDGSYRNAANAEEQKTAEGADRGRGARPARGPHRIEPGYLEPGLVSIGGYRVR
jgi:hypothetical protein